MENPYELEDQLAVKNEDGVVALRVALFATLYFEDGSSEEARQQIVKCINFCSNVVADHIKFVKNPTNFAWEPYTPDSGNVIGDFISQLDEDDQYEYGFKGGESEDEASHFEIKGLSSATWKPIPSYFRFAVPITYFSDREDHFIDVVKQLCQFLSPIHGYAGLGLIESPNGTIAQEVEPLVYSMAQRFEGLEVDRPHSHALFIKDGIKSINWLTIVGPTLVEKIGGANELVKRLGDDNIMDLANCLIVKASEKPQLGDANQQIRVDDYRKVAKVLKPIMISSHRNFHSGLPNRFTKESSKAWLKRFLD